MEGEWGAGRALPAFSAGGEAVAGSRREGTQWSRDRGGEAPGPGRVTEASWSVSFSESTSRS